MACLKSRPLLDKYIGVLSHVPVLAQSSTLHSAACACRTQHLHAVAVPAAVCTQSPSQGWQCLYRYWHQTASQVFSSPDMAVYLCMQSLLEGKTDELPARVCDVRDVARAHVRAIEDPSASGRHIISQPNNIPSQVIVDILKKRFPDNSRLRGKDGDTSPIIDNSKVIHKHPTPPSCLKLLQARHLQVETASMLFKTGSSYTSMFLVLYSLTRCACPAG